MRITALLVVLLAVAGCEEAAEEQASVAKPAMNESTPAVSATAPDRRIVGPEQLTERQMQQWLRSCALCHVTGVAGAPLVGSAEQWRPRWQQGRDVLLDHTIEGFNAMPPLGYCMSCEQEDFGAMIDFMAGEAKWQP